MKISGAAILAARILVVDDKAANVSLLEQMLHAAGYENVTATMDPREVRTLHRSNRYDLILLDLQMPGMDGFQVMDGLRADDTHGWLPVLVITAEPGHKLRALQSGARDFIAKPFDLVEVRTRIHNMLEARLLYQRLEDRGRELEEAVRVRTAQLHESQARYRSLIELASDWYWEQDENGRFTTVSGPVLELLGIPLEGQDAGAQAAEAAGWDQAQREAVLAAIAARQPFLDRVFSRVNADGSQQRFQVSGEPMFGPAFKFLGYRGFGLEITSRR